MVVVQGKGDVIVRRGVHGFGLLRRCMPVRPGQDRKARPAVPWWRRRRPRPNARAAGRSERVGWWLCGSCESRSPPGCRARGRGGSPGRRIAVAGLDNKTAAGARAGCFDHRGARRVHGGQAVQIKRSARSQEGTPSGPVPSGSTRWPVGVSQIPSSFHAINSSMLGSSSTSSCQRLSEPSAAFLLPTHCASPSLSFGTATPNGINKLERHRGVYGTTFV